MENVMNTGIDSSENTTLNQYLTFILDGEEYGIPIMKVNGIQGFEKSRAIPKSPDYILGIINLRGEVVPNIDLRIRLGLDSIPYDALTVVVVVKVQNKGEVRTIGLVVDAVADVLVIDSDEVSSTPDFGGGESVDFLQGIAMKDEKLISLLDVDRLVNWNESSCETLEQEYQAPAVA